MSELDLETGKPAEPDTEPKKRRGRPPGSKNNTSDTVVTTRTENVLTRLAEVLEGRGETELSSALREDARAIGGAMTTITGTFKGLRNPYLAILGVLEPVFAFGRVMRIAWGKLRTRREVPQGDYVEGAE